MTREEFAALLAEICGIRLQPVERDTILAAADSYAVALAAVARRRAQLAAIEITEADCA